MTDLRKRRDDESSAQTTTETIDTDVTATDDAKTKIDKSGLYDLQQVKRLLDDQVIAFLEQNGYEEAVLTSNIKLLFGVIAVAAAIYSHFGLEDFAENKHIVLYCVVTYGVCLFIINITSFIVEAGALFVGYLNPRLTKITKGSRAPKIWIHTTIGYHGSSEYKVELRTSARDKKEASMQSNSYEKYFTDQGRFLIKPFTSDLQKLVEQLKDSKKDK